MLGKDNYSGDIKDNLLKNRAAKSQEAEETFRRNYEDFRDKLNWIWHSFNNASLKSTEPSDLKLTLNTDGTISLYSEDGQPSLVKLRWTSKREFQYAINLIRRCFMEYRIRYPWLWIWFYRYTQKVPKEFKMVTGHCMI